MATYEKLKVSSLLRAIIIKLVLFVIYVLDYDQLTIFWKAFPFILISNKVFKDRDPVYCQISILCAFTLNTTTKVSLQKVFA